MMNRSAKRDKKVLGLIGFGNMGSAIFERLKTDFQLYVFDKDKNKFSEVPDIKIAFNSVYLIKAVDTAILAVKPQDYESVLKEIKDYSKNKLIVSIAAGITTGYLQQCLIGAKVIRAMPNLPARAGKGMICLCRGESATEEDLGLVRDLFNYLGTTLELENDDMIDAATAISGSGPGYLYDLCEGRSLEEMKAYANDIFVPSLIQAAESVGFKHEHAKLLAETTAEGSLFFLEQTGYSAQELKKQVVSKGGTTEAALEVLHNGGSLQDAVKAALIRSKELLKTVS